MLYTKKGATVNRHSLSFFCNFIYNVLSGYRASHHSGSSFSHLANQAKNRVLPFQAFFVISYTVVFSVNLDKFHCLAE